VDISRYTGNYSMFLGHAVGLAGVQAWHGMAGEFVPHLFIQFPRGVMDGRISIAMTLYIGSMLICSGENICNGSLWGTYLAIFNINYIFWNCPDVTLAS
jgi:hypothetical protein